MKTLVLGLGNPILTDDGVGVRVAEAVRAALPVDSGIEVSEASVGGLSLMERLVGYERVILIDAFHPATHPGAIHRLTLTDLQNISPTQHSASAHDTSLVTALTMARRMELSLPQEFVIYAIEVENITDFGEQPTPAVAAAIPQAAMMVLQQLDAWTKRQGITPTP
jgi:hydrogenase maturation protease